MSNTKKKELITKTDSILWGAIVLIPFGWLVLWANINHRRSEVERGLRDKESAINSINNYVIGAVVFCLLWIIVAFGQGTLMIINVIAFFVLAISSIRNIERIKDSGADTNPTSRTVTGEESEGGILEYDEYLLRAKQLQKRLDSIDRGDRDYEKAITELKNDINDFFDVFKDAEFEKGGRYKVYELKAEYYFIVGNKQLAKKYINQAIEIREKEKTLFSDSFSVEGEDIDYEL